MRWLSARKTVLAYLAAILLAGNFVAAFAQGRPEAGPFDAARITMQPPPPEGVAIRAGRLFDPRTGTNLANQVIIVQGDRITDVGPADRVKIPAGARVIDLSNATVLPGLIDRHVHLFQDPEPNEARALIVGQHYALADLYAGFTTLQDLNSPYTYASVELRDAINKGMLPTPSASSSWDLLRCFFRATCCRRIFIQCWAPCPGYRSCGSAVPSFTNASGWRWGSGAIITIITTMVL